MKSAGGSVALHVGCGRSRYFEITFILKLPDEGAEFAGDRDNAFGIADTPRPQCAVTFAEPVLHAPREGFDLLALSDLPRGESSADLRCAAEVLSTFHQHPADMGVAAFGNASLPPL